MDEEKQGIQLDVVELCAMMQCLGFSVRSMDTSDTNCSQDAANKTVVVNCQFSGLHVVMESVAVECSCPVARNDASSGFWQVSGVSRGVVHGKETGSSLFSSLPKTARDHVTSELKKLLQYIQNYNEELPVRSEDKPDPMSAFNGPNKDTISNMSASMNNLNVTPPESRLLDKLTTPTRYRSLDALTNMNTEPELPEPGPLIAKNASVSDTSDVLDEMVAMPHNKKVKKMQQGLRRQETYTVSTPGKSEPRNRKKTSSPLVKVTDKVVKSLISAEKKVGELLSMLTTIIKDVTSEEDKDSSVASLALDVSKISVMSKATDGPSKSQFASSPNLSALGALPDIDHKCNLKRADSVSASHLQPSSEKNKAPSRLRRLSPGFFGMRKDNSVTSKVASLTKTSSIKMPDNRASKLNSLLKHKPAVVPIRSPRPKTSNDSVSSIASSKKKYGYIRSTIPKPMSASKKD